MHFSPMRVGAWARQATKGNIRSSRGEGQPAPATRGRNGEDTHAEGHPPGAGPGRNQDRDRCARHAEGASACVVASPRQSRATTRRLPRWRIWCAKSNSSLALPPNVSPVGVGTPGSISRATGLLRGSNSVALNGRPLREDLAALLGREVRISNDANCFALSEATDGAGRGADVVFGVILGTGVGAGIVVHGRVLDGANAIAGEWGHNPLPWPRDDERPGRACFCGHAGCIETWLSGPGIAADHQRVTGSAMAAPDIVAGAAARRYRVRGHPGALRGAAGPFAGARHQHRRSRCDRAGRRHVECRAPLRQRSPAMGRVDILRPRGHAARQACARRFERRARSRMAVELNAVQRHIPV